MSLLRDVRQHGWFWFLSLGAAERQQLLGHVRWRVPTAVGPA